MRRCIRPVLSLLLTAIALPAAANDYPQVRVETTAGEFVVELDAARAPLTVENFLQYVRDGFYDGTIFHRVIAGFVIQGGGYTLPAGESGAEPQAKKTRAPVVNESGNGLSNRRLTIAMARTAEPHSADSQFYINLQDNTDLDPKPTRWGYTVFGQVIQGTDVVDDIGYRPTSPVGSFQELPAAPVIIERMSIVAPESGG
jgi:cyclophilin family peptidyl-prolyl cis-trans isomerase